MNGLHSVVSTGDSRTRSEADLRTQLKDLESKDACAVFLYRVQPSPTGSDVWPDIRDISKVPASYQVLQLLRSRPVPGLSAVEDLLEAPTFRLVKQLQPRSEGMPQVGTSGKGWPQRRLPTELYELICSHLARDDIKAMRLCCKEFDQHVSQTLFHTVVVPFNTEIYDMLKPRTKKRDVKGKGKSRAADDDTDAASAYDIFQWKNEKDDEVYEGHGVDVFKGFGPHIRRYGMSFEVDESTLKFPPHKGSLEDHVSYWGAYQWPYQEYHRFEDVASLETTADETPKMKTAFSFLTKVRHLAVSLNCGLGWLKGPDVSLRSRILKRSPTVFGPTRAIPDRKTQAQELLWAHIEEAHFRATHDRTSVRHAELFRQDVIDPVAGTHGYSSVLQHDTSHENLQFFDAGLPSDAPYDEGRHTKTIWGPPGSPREMNGEFGLSRGAAEPQEPAWKSLPPFVLKEGILYTSSTRQDSHNQHNFLVPNDLSKAQKEWLLEIEWAQRAFLSSYMLAVMDNASVFAGVERLDFSRISSRFVSQLCRADFWDSLPGLETVSIQVIPDWHDVTKDNAGIVETQTIHPSRAVGPFVKLLADIIAPRENIRNLSIGWADGGEHAEGMFARNQHILIAPLVEVNHDFAHHLISRDLVLLLPHVEHLTLTNCWITPHHLQSLVRNHANCALTKLTLDSVSLTVVPRANPLIPLGPPPGQPMWAGAVALQQLLTQNMQQLHHHFNNPANPAHPGVPLGHGLTWNPHAAPGALGGGGGPPAPPQLPQFIPPAYAPPPPAPPPQPAQPNQTDMSYLGPHREGSWPHVLDAISPGVRLSDFSSSSPSSSSPSPAAPADPVPRPHTSLLTLELHSVGYVKLPHARFDQSALLPPANPIPGFTIQGLRNNCFLKRAGGLQGDMMGVKDELLGEVVQYMPPAELRCLSVVWSLREGWADIRKAEEPEFDGFLAGGTGRVSGVIRASDRPPVAEGTDGS
ncbi:hypothetical protein H2201_005346 [Coniosporium apollinis]|uniref:F-box domain-containing protein n=1 Tax=Coniosporium apollinis TaxID=61459 RepID=A0ABQ9NQZ6_9PEZI|nr:hypothetical protein H2201_005346 [Coniosporium apollinis]